QIKFELTEENLLIFRPDGEKFHSFVELGQLKEQALKEKEQALKELDQEKQRVKALEALLKEKDINYD
ncbi:MAG: Uma2 family endonuclease, partial [Cyanobacteria bacterium P01_F01_bin.143]